MSLASGRYVLFVFPGYYPRGGWDDAIDRSDDLDALKVAAVANLQGRGEHYCGDPCADIVDLSIGEIVWHRHWLDRNAPL